MAPDVRGDQGWDQREAGRREASRAAFPTAAIRPWNSDDVAAFSSRQPHHSSCTRIQQPATVFTLFAAEDGSEVDSSEDNAATKNEESQVAVKFWKGYGAP